MFAQQLLLADGALTLRAPLSIDTESQLDVLEVATRDILKRFETQVANVYLRAQGRCLYFKGPFFGFDQRMLPILIRQLVAHHPVAVESQWREQQLIGAVEILPIEDPDEQRDNWRRRRHAQPLSNGDATVS
jgi:hypothetical protein